MKSRIAFLILISACFSMKAQWAVESSGFSTNGLGINHISVVNSNVVWATAYDTAFATVVNKFTRTLNGGTTWIAGTVNGAAAFDLTSVSAINKDTAWVSMVDNGAGGGRIYKTTNGGLNWTNQTTATFASPGGWADFVHFFNTTTGVCVGDSNTGYWEIYTTSNAGTNWTRVPSGSIPSNMIGETANDDSYCSLGSNVWFGTTSGRVYKTTNMGTTWTVSATGLTNVKSVSFKDAMNGIATDGTAIATSTNGGVSWSNLTFTGNLLGNDLCFVPGTSGTYVSTGWGSGNNGSSYSTNNGMSWTTIDAVGHDAVSFLNSSTGWSGGFNSSPTSGGMFKWAGVFTGISNLSTANNNFINAYPNPFSKQFTIETKSKNTINLMVEVYDVLGNLVLKSDDFENGKVTIKSNAFVSGIYFYKVFDANGSVSAGKLICE